LTWIPETKEGVTLTRTKEVFEPIAPPHVGLYTCGPTVYNFAHIGNLRTFLFEDLLRRWLEASGFGVLHIMNLTDVDDRIIKEAGAKGTSIRSFTEPFATAFFEDRDYLHLWKVTHVTPGKRITYSWRYGGYPGESSVTWDLSETAEGTKLRLVHEGIETFPQDNPIFSREAGQAGWTYFVSRSLAEFLGRPNS